MGRERYITQVIRPPFEDSSYLNNSSTSKQASLLPNHLTNYQFNTTHEQSHQHSITEMLSNTLLMATAAILGLTAAAPSNIVTTYNCDTFKFQCAANVAAGNIAQSSCDRSYDACLSCSTLEHSCRVGAADSYPAQLHCTSSSEVCYQMAVSPGQTQGYYGCKEAFSSCNAGPLANRSLCASQDAACK